jgi:hypothetical protein
MPVGIMLSQSWIICALYYINAIMDINYNIGQLNYLTVIKWDLSEIYFVLWL